MSIQKTASNDRISFPERFAFALGDVAANFFLQMIAVFIMIFYTDVLGLTAVVAGTVAMMSRIFDGVNDLIIGYLADKYGQYKKWVLWGSLLAGIFFVFMFFVPNLSETGKAVYAFVTFSLWTLAYTAYQVPYSALNSTITGDESERVKLNSIRFAVILIPILFISVGVPALMPAVAAALGGTAQAYLAFAAISGVLGFICSVICVKGVRERVVVSKTAERVVFKDAMAALSQNKPLLILSLAWFFSSLQYNMSSAAGPYFFGYFIGKPALMSLFALGSIPVSLVGMLCAPSLSKKFGSKKVLIGAGLIIFATGLVRFFVATSLVPLIILTVISSFQTGIINVLAFSLVSETVGYGYRKTGKNVRALNFSIFIFMQKLAMGLSATLLGGVLALFGYVANTAQTPQALNGIVLLYTIIPSAFALLMSVILTRFDLSK